MIRGMKITYWEVDVTVVLTKDPHDLRESFVDGDIEGCALGIVQQVCIGSLADKHMDNFSLIPGVKKKKLDTDQKMEILCLQLLGMQHHEYLGSCILLLSHKKKKS